MLYCGIDNGLSGGLTFIESGEVSPCTSLRLFVTPTIKSTKGKNKREYDIWQISTIFKDLKPDMVYVEKASARPGQGVTSMFSIGYGYGMYLAILATLDIPYKIITPQKWQKSMFSGMCINDTKACSIQVAKQLFPTVNFVPEGCRKPHDGLTDSALICYYGMQMENGVTALYQRKDK